MILCINIYLKQKSKIKLFMQLLFLLFYQTQFIILLNCARFVYRIVYRKEMKFNDYELTIIKIIVNKSNN